MNKRQSGSDDQSGPGPRIDPSAEPLSASELMEDNAGEGRIDEEPPLKHNAPAEIDIERGDTDEPGNTPDEIVTPATAPPD